MRRSELRSSVNMKHAEAEAQLSTCKSLSVGAVAVLNNQIIATGYNGVQSGMEHCGDFYAANPDSKMEHKDFADKYEIHAEMNVIMDALDRGIPLRGSVVYCTHQPCWNCAKHLSRAGVKEVIFRDLYWRLSHYDLMEMNRVFGKTTLFRQYLTPEE